MPRRKKTHEEFVEKLNSITNEIEVVGVYNDSNTKVEFKCLVKPEHGSWFTQPRHLLEGKRCPKCANPKKTHSKFVEQLRSVNPLVKVIGNYKGARTKIEVKCLKNESHPNWEASPDNLLRGYGCPHCAGNIKKTHQEFVRNLLEINPNIQLISKYTNGGERVKVKCLLNSSHPTWETRPNHLLNGTGCPSCSSMGFNPSRMSYVYLGEINFKGKEYYKVGLCNKKPFKRLKECHLSFRLIAYKEIQDGTEAQALEKKILLDMAEYRTDELKGFLRSGYTEILTESPSLDYFS